MTHFRWIANNRALYNDRVRSNAIESLCCKSHAFVFLIKMNANGCIYQPYIVLSHIDGFVHLYSNFVISNFTLSNNLLPLMAGERLDEPKRTQAKQHKAIPFVRLIEFFHQFDDTYWRLWCFCLEFVCYCQVIIHYFLFWILEL